MMQIKLNLQILLLTLLSVSSVAQTQGTLFNYQGRLMNNNVAAEGSYDFLFTLHDAEVVGNAVGEPLAHAAIEVTAGQFLVPLDFGAGVFTGAVRWLEISVRVTGDVEPHTILEPRQALLPTPYAMYAGTAGNVATGTVTAAQLNTGESAPVPGQFLSYDGGNLVWSDPGAAVGDLWSIDGVNVYYSAGNVGIGGIAGTSKLLITGANPLTLSGPQPYLTWHDTLTDRSAHISSAGGTLYYRVPNAAGDLVTAGYEDSNGSVVRGRIHVEGNGPYITWADSGTGKSASISSANGALYYRVPNAAGNIVTAGYEDSNGSVVRGRIQVEGDGPYITWADSGTGKSASISSANGALYYRVPNAAGDVITAGYADSNGLVVRGRLVVEGAGEAFLNGPMSCQVLTIRGGADVAEPFVMPDEIVKGSVVVIDEEHPGQLKLSTEAYDTRVAGIVSGANGIQPGIALHQEGVLEGGQNVALSGRVFVQADAAFGAIRPGDLLTTSDTPGHAMKATDPSKAQGAILGKAMTSLVEGTGMILVLVTLQ
jgi:hypothetical protein